MNRSLMLCLVLLTASLGACSRQAPSGAPPPSSSAQAAPGPAALPASAQASQNPGSPAAAESSGAQSSAADAANDLPAGTTSLERVADLPAQQQLPANGRWKPGVNYDPVVPAQPTNVAPGKVEVLEVFWFACPHCYALEPYLVAWRKTKPDYIQFVRVPVMWGPVHRAHAQLYYTLQELGRSDLDGKVFDTLHQGGETMLFGSTPEDTFQQQLKFAEQNGIDAEAFRKAYNSFAVNADLQHAEDITQRYHVEGVPFIVVNGKYATDVGKAGSHEDLIALINYLAAFEHRRQH